VLSVENLKSSYGRIEALHGVSIEVPAGEIVTLVGANGAGKSTLLRAISGVQSISGGRILYQGRAIEAALRARAVPQDRAMPEGRQYSGRFRSRQSQARRLTRPAASIAAELARS
jgi:branched-chain amino acid transport system ATP-binding protein